MKPFRKPPKQEAPPEPKNQESPTVTAIKAAIISCGAYRDQLLREVERSAAVGAWRDCARYSQDVAIAEAEIQGLVRALSIIEGKGGAK